MTALSGMPGSEGVGSGAWMRRAALAPREDSTATASAARSPASPSPGTSVGRASPVSDGVLSLPRQTEEELLSRIQALQFQLQDLRDMAPGGAGGSYGEGRSASAAALMTSGTPPHVSISPRGTLGASGLASASLPSMQRLSLAASSSDLPGAATAAAAVEAPSAATATAATGGQRSMSESNVVGLATGSSRAASSADLSAVPTPDGAGTPSLPLSARATEERSARSAAATTEATPEPPGGSDAYRPKLIVVSNRLPLTVKRTPVGGYEYIMSAGGLVTALESALEQRNMPAVWVGWPGGNVAIADQERVRAQLLEEHALMPVYLDEQLYELYYNGFCNDVLWPLFHYVPLQVVTQDGERKFDYKFWTAYMTANHRFSEAVLSVYRPGDQVWVQDYHLMLLPSLLRKRLRRAAQIGFFLHTPFPSSEVYRILPVRKEILQGVLAADLIGFHTFDYARHFLSVCARTLGLESSPRGVDFQGHFARVGIFPIGIDPQHFLRTLEQPSVRARIDELQERFRNERVLIGVDRLDYIKGVPHKLLALETLLTRYPEWKDKVVLIQIAVPSRTEVEDYRKLISHTNELVGRINGQFGSVDYAPIMFINQSIPFEELCALYSVADAAVITSVRDGMNLVSYEYVMCQRDTCGVLVLSEFAGSAQSLSGALRVNPWNVEELAAAIHEALTMTDRERQMKHWKLYRYVTTHTASYWASSFIAELKQAGALRGDGQQRHPLLPKVDLLAGLRQATLRLVLLAYEGALVEPRSVPDLAAPDHSLFRMLSRVCTDPRNLVFVMSERDRARLLSWFTQYEGEGGEVRRDHRSAQIGLIAENGQFYRFPGVHTEWKATVATEAGEAVTPTAEQRAREHDWRQQVLPILNYYTERTPGSFLEQKERSLSWHYRDADPDYGVWQAHELKAHLTEWCAHLPVEVVGVGSGGSGGGSGSGGGGGGAKCIEIRLAGASRAKAVARIREETPGPIDLVLCIGGNSRDDEELFGYLRAAPSPGEAPPASAVWTCRVGSDTHDHTDGEWTLAQYRLPDYGSAKAVLKEIAALVPGLNRPRQRDGERRRRLPSQRF